MSGYIRAIANTIKSISIDFTKDINRYHSTGYSDDFKEKNFEKIKKNLPTFNEPVTDDYDDRYTLMLNFNYKNIAKKYAIIPIPNNWFENHNFSNFIHDLEGNSGISLISSYDTEDAQYFEGWMKRFRT
jgi:hypothetical protein